MSLQLIFASLYIAISLSATTVYGKDFKCNHDDLLRALLRHTEGLAFCTEFDTASLPYENNLPTFLPLKSYPVSVLSSACYCLTYSITSTATSATSTSTGLSTTVSTSATSIQSSNGSQCPVSCISTVTLVDDGGNTVTLGPTVTITSVSISHISITSSSTPTFIDDGKNSVTSRSTSSAFTTF